MKSSIFLMGFAACAAAYAQYPAPGQPAPAASAAPAMQAASAAPPIAMVQPAQAAQPVQPVQPMPIPMQPAQPGGVARAPAPPAPATPPVATLPADAPKIVINGGVYSESPAARAAIVNGHVAREGDEVGSGVVLEQIRPQGVVLAYRGARYTVVY